MTPSLKEMCKSLRLAYVADIYKDISFENPSDYLEALFQQELEQREMAKGERLIKKAKFMSKKELDSFQWNRVFVDARLTAALVDRVIHHAHILSFTGDSYRVTHALSNHQ